MAACRRWRVRARVECAVNVVDIELEGTGGRGGRSVYHHLSGGADGLSAHFHTDRMHARGGGHKLEGICPILFIAHLDGEERIVVAGGLDMHRDLLTTLGEGVAGRVVGA